MSELIPLNTNGLNPIEVFKPEKVSEILQKIGSEAEKFIQEFGDDVGTKAARDQIVSFAFKITKSKTAIDALGKDLVSEWKEKSAAVDKERKRIRDTLDELAEKVRKPVTDWELAEEQRINLHLQSLDALSEIGRYAKESPMLVTIELLEEAQRKSQELYESRDWQDYGDTATLQAAQNAQAFAQAISARKQYEDDQEELKALRLKEAERLKEQDRIEEHRKHIDALNMIGTRLMSMSKNQIGVMIEDLKISTTRDFEEFTAQHQEAVNFAIAALQVRYDELEEKEKAAIIAQEKDRADKHRRALSVIRDWNAGLPEYPAVPDIRNALKSVQGYFSHDTLLQEEIDKAYQAAAREAEALLKAAGERERLAVEKAEQAVRESNNRHKGKVNREAREDILKLIALGSVEDENLHGMQFVAQAIVEAIAKGKVRHISIKY